MQFTKRSRLASVLAAGLGAVLSSGLAAQPAHADGVPAPATYRLRVASVYTGQPVTIIQTPVTENDDDEPLERSINWGDGTTDAWFTGETETHQYRRPGSYRILVEEHSQAGDGTATFIGTDTVTVNKITGTYRLSARSTWTGSAAKSVSLPVSLSLTGVPANAPRVKIDWDDATASTVSRTAKPIVHTFKSSGDHAVSVALVNAIGESDPLIVGNVKAVTDVYRPTVTLGTPKKPKKAASWSVIKGTAADRGSGVATVTVQLGEMRGAKYYEYNGRTWIKTKVSKAGKRAPLRIRPAKTGAWSLQVKGLTKGTLIIGYAAWDKTGNVTRASRNVKLTS